MHKSLCFRDLAGSQRKEALYHNMINTKHLMESTDDGGREFQTHQGWASFSFLRSYACGLSCIQLFLTLWTIASSVHGIFQARILEWVAISSSRGSSQPETEPTSLVSPALAGRFFVTAPPGKPFSFLLNCRFHLCLFTVVSHYLPYIESSSIF